MGDRVVRGLARVELDVLIDWAAAEGWNPGFADAEAFWAADPEGFFGAFVDGQMAAGIAAVAYDQAFGFIGLYICHPDFRGQGHGKAVWDAGMARLGGRVIGLDGVPEQQSNYAAMGFARQYETVRMSGVLPEAKRAGGAAEFAAVADFDRQVFPADRGGFLEQWLDGPHEVMVATGAGGVTGYAVKRACREGAKIGPLYADDVLVAMDLLEGFSGPVQIDVPVAQAGLIEQLLKLGFEPGFQTARMYRGAAPEIDLKKVFGITSLELG